MPAAQWYDARVADIVDLAPDVRQFVLELPELQTFTYQPGQFVTLDLPVHTKRLMRWRSYSIAAAPNGSNQIELCIVRAAHGIGTTYLFEQINEGSTLRLKGPEGNFTLPSNLPGIGLTLICTGTGIAPFRAMLQHLFRDSSPPNIPIHLIHGTRYASGLLYQKEWEALAQQYPQFRYSPVLSRQADWAGHKGYVHSVYQANHQPGTHYYLCGWTPMVDQARQQLQAIGVSPEHIKFELYG